MLKEQIFNDVKEQFFKHLEQLEKNDTEEKISVPMLKFNEFCNRITDEIISTMEKNSNISYEEVLGNCIKELFEY